MTIQVKELIVRAIIDDDSNESIPGDVVDEIIQDCVDQVLIIVRMNEEDIR